MKVLVNNKETVLPDGSNVAGLVAQLGLPDKGIAIAANNQLIPQSQWDSRILQPEEHLIIIKAACGG